MIVKSKVWLEKDGELVFGMGKALILKYISETGSIIKAAKKLNMSYRHAWSYIRSAEKRLRIPLIQCIRGGKDGGGTILTSYAKDLLDKFTRLDHDVKKYTDRHYKNILK